MGKIGRNDTCPCGSGKKYKNCCIDKKDLNIKRDKELAEKIIQGYNLAAVNRCADACDIWLDVWNYLKKRFGPNGFKNIDRASEDFKGDVYLSSWIGDLEMHLHNAGLKNKDYFKKRINFCQDIFQSLPKSDEEIIRNMKRAEAASYFYLGDIEKGDQKFQQLITEYPNWAWGYIGWGDIYGIARVVPDPEKAEKIYRMAFDAELEEKEDSLDYLEERLLNLE
ncbi:MAG: SEC-C metal-binding domain-containing protein [Halanaerobium sp.]